MGNETIATLSVASGRLVARVPPDLELAAGDRVWFTIADERALLFDAATGRRIQPVGASATAATAP
jgi:ABC-type sugar transport system ATPase subunit